MPLKDLLIVYSTGTQKEIYQYLDRDLIIGKPLHARNFYIMGALEGGVLVGNGLGYLLLPLPSPFAIVDDIAFYTLLADGAFRLTGTAIKTVKNYWDERQSENTREFLDYLANPSSMPGLVGRVRELFKSIRKTQIETP